MGTRENIEVVSVLITTFTEHPQYIIS